MDNIINIASIEKKDVDMDIVNIYKKKWTWFSVD